MTNTKIVDLVGGPHDGEQLEVDNGATVIRVPMLNEYRTIEDIINQRSDKFEGHIASYETSDDPMRYHFTGRAKYQP